MHIPPHSPHETHHELYHPNGDGGTGGPSGSGASAGELATLRRRTRGALTRRNFAPGVDQQTEGFGLITQQDTQDVRVVHYLTAAQLGSLGAAEATTRRREALQRYEAALHAAGLVTSVLQDRTGEYQLTVPLADNPPRPRTPRV